MPTAAVLIAAFLPAVAKSQSPPSTVWSFDKMAGTGGSVYVHMPLRVPMITNGNVPIVLPGADPAKQFDWHIIATGKFGRGGAPAFNKFSVYDTADASEAGDQPAALGIYYTTGRGAKGGRSALNVGYLVSGDYGSAAGSFATAGEFRATAGAKMGGAPGAPAGQVDTFSTYGIATAGATNLVNVSTEEANTTVMYGASSVYEVMKQLAGLSTDWGTVHYSVGTNGGTPGVGGRMYEMWVRQAPSVDASSAASIAVSAGHNLPDYDYGTLVGSVIHEWPFGAGSKFLAFQQQRMPNHNSYGDIPPARAKFMNLGWGMDFSGVNIVHQSFRSSGFSVEGTGEVDIGRTAIIPSSTGITIVPAALKGVTAVSIVKGGKGFAVGDQLNGPSGDIYTVSSVAGGIITGIRQTSIGYSKTPPPNPVTLTGATVESPTVNLSWTAGASVGIVGDLDTVGHVKSSGEQPGRLTSCGEHPSVVAGSTDTRGTIHLGTGVTIKACTLVFANTYNVAPRCLLNAMVSGIPIAAAMTVSTTRSATFAFASSASGGTAIYNCWE